MFENSEIKLNCDPFFGSQFSFFFIYSLIIPQEVIPIPKK